jgi:hypothetical protein
MPNAIKMAIAPPFDVVLAISAAMTRSLAKLWSGRARRAVKFQQRSDAPAAGNRSTKIPMI